MKKVLSTIIGLVIVGVLLTGAGLYVQRAALLAGAQAVTITTQKDTIERLTGEKAAMTDRLTLCLDDTARYKGYSSEQADMLRGVQEKWGVNYSIPIKDVFAILQASTDQLDCK